MLAKVTSLAVIGLDGAAIQVEVDMSRGMPVFIIVGLRDAAVQESKERVRGDKELGRPLARSPHHGQPGSGRLA
jgi:hypothetical protein